MLQRIKKSVEKIFRQNFKLRKGERVLILTDAPLSKDVERKDPVLLEEMSERVELALNVWRVGRKLFKNNLFNFYAYPSTWQHGKEPGKEVEKLMKNHDVVVAITTFSLSHTKARRRATKAGVRIASMPGATKQMFFEQGALNVNYRRLKAYCQKWKKLAESADTARITTDSGTDIEIGIANPFEVDDGDLSYEGAFGNLPAGEVFAAPDDANGILVVEPNEGLNLFERMEISIENGKVVSIGGERFFGRELEAKLGLNRKTPTKKQLSRRVIAELGIGVNYKAKDPTNVLEAEKIKGTVHVAIGDNSSFPNGKNYSDLHIDFVLFKPTLRLDGILVMKKGKWSV
ncbi:MAG: hypothetical protein J7K98_04100 [Candidatus Aenigmarchaeota archaeon]|nr:hypothetical protein [Candidatus Aenigmarchaeota archaeon]